MLGVWTGPCATNSAAAPVPTGKTRQKTPCRLIKGVSEERSALPRYEDTWNVDIVLKYLDRLLEAQIQ